jgi:hypothetical protein
MFIPGVMAVGTTIGDLMAQGDGLSLAKAADRRGRAGPNLIPLQRPTILNSIYKEFSKTFYLYQLYMSWTWFNCKCSKCLTTATLTGHSHWFGLMQGTRRETSANYSSFIRQHSLLL